MGEVERRRDSDRHFVSSTWLMSSFWHTQSILIKVSEPLACSSQMRPQLLPCASPFVSHVNKGHNPKFQVAIFVSHWWSRLAAIEPKTLGSVSSWASETSVPRSTSKRCTTSTHRKSTQAGSEAAAVESRNSREEGTIVVLVFKERPSVSNVDCEDGIGRSVRKQQEASAVLTG